MMSGVAIAPRCRPASPPAVMWIISAQVSGASSRGSTQMRLDLRVEPRRAVRVGRADDDRPRRVPAGQRLDRRGAVLRHLGPAGDDDEVHHAGPCRDAPPGLAVRLGRQVLAGPDPGELRLDARRCCRPAPTSAGPARRPWPGCRSPRRPRSGASAGRRARAARRPRAVPTSRRRSSGSRGAGRVGPRLDDRVDDAPRLLDLVGAGEQRGVALERVEDQRLVGVGRVDVERRAVGEVHRHRADVQAEPRHLGPEPQHDALVGLDADGQQVRVRVRPRRRGTAGAAPRGTGWRSRSRASGRRLPVRT